MMATPDFLEPHYTLGELAKAWHMSRSSIHPYAIAEKEGVIRYGEGKLNKGRRRTYVSMRISESAARRIYRRITGRDFQPAKG